MHDWSAEASELGPDDLPQMGGGLRTFDSLITLPCPTVTVTQCGRVCFGRQKIHLSTVFAGQNVGIKQVADKIWLVSFMEYDLGFFDDETYRLGTAENPFGAKVLPMSPV